MSVKVGTLLLSARYNLLHHHPILGSMLRRNVGY